MVTCDPQYFREWQFTLQFTKWVVWSIETNKSGTASIMGEWEPLASNWATLELLLHYLFLVKVTFDKSKTITRLLFVTRIINRSDFVNIYFIRKTSYSNFIFSSNMAKSLTIIYLSFQGVFKLCQGEKCWCVPGVKRYYNFLEKQ